MGHRDDCTFCPTGRHGAKTFAAENLIFGNLVFAKVASFGALVLKIEDRAAHRSGGKSGEWLRAMAFDTRWLDPGHFFEELWIYVVKLPRAHGGCLGIRRLGRAWKTAKSPGKLSNER